MTFRFLAMFLCLVMGSASAQVAPPARDIAGYTGLFAAAARGDTAEIERLASEGANVNARDPYGRTPFSQWIAGPVNPARPHDAQQTGDCARPSDDEHRKNPGYQG